LVIKLLAPFAPHITEELWFNLGEKKSIHLVSWPKWDPKLIIDERVKIAVQVNGKVRTELEIEADLGEEKVKEIVMKNEVVQRWLEGKSIRKFIYVKNKLVNIVIG